MPSVASTLLDSNELRIWQKLDHKFQCDSGSKTKIGNTLKKLNSFDANQRQQHEQVKSNKVSSCMPIHQGLCSVNHQVRWDTLLLFFRNHGSHRLYHFHQVGGNCCRGRLKIVDSCRVETTQTQRQGKRHCVDFDGGGEEIVDATLIKFTEYDSKKILRPTKLPRS